MLIKFEWSRHLPSVLQSRGLWCRSSCIDLEFPLEPAGHYHAAPSWSPYIMSWGQRASPVNESLAAADSTCTLTGMERAMTLPMLPSTLPSMTRVSRFRSRGERKYRASLFRGQACLMVKTSLCRNCISKLNTWELYFWINIWEYIRVAFRLTASDNASGIFLTRSTRRHTRARTCAFANTCTVARLHSGFPYRNLYHCMSAGTITCHCMLRARAFASMPVHHRTPHEHA